MENIGGNAVSDLENASKGFRRQHGGSAKRGIAQDRCYERLKVFIGGPTVQGRLLEPARELNVTADGLPGFVDTKADQRNLKKIAEETQCVQVDTLLAVGPGKDVVDLVDHQHLYTDGRHDPQGGLFHLGNIGPRLLRGAQKGEQLAVEPSLPRAADHLHGQDRCFQNSALAIKT